MISRTLWTHTQTFTGLSQMWFQHWEGKWTWGPAFNQEAMCSWYLLAKTKSVSPIESLWTCQSHSIGPAPRSIWPTQNEFDIFVFFSFWERKTDDEVEWIGRWGNLRDNCGKQKHDKGILYMYLIRKNLKYLLCLKRTKKKTNNAIKWMIYI